MSKPRDANENLNRFLNDLRFGADRRAGADRRSGETGGTPPGIERRSADRRTSDRRSPPAGTFTTDEVRRIRAMLERDEAAGICPRCGGGLLRGPTTGSPGLVMQEVHCTGCRYGALIIWR